MRFRYVAATTAGTIERGVREASSEQALVQQLEAEQRVVMSIQPDHRAVTTTTQAAKRIGIGHVALLDKIILVRHLAVMLRSGLPIIEALDAILDQTSSKKMQEIIHSLIDQVTNGKSLGDSLAQFPKVFGGLIVGMVRVGEASGTLDQNLEYVAKVLEKDYELRRKVHSAMIYPTIVLSATGLLGIGLTIFILPRLVDMFATFRLKLPLITRVFLALANFLVDYGIFLLIMLIATLIGLRIAMRASATKPFFHALYLRLPIIKKMSLTVNIARLARVMSILLASGVTINESLDIAARVVSNVYYRRLLIASRSAVQQGQTLSHTLRRDIYFPTMASRMLAEGEKTGKLQDSFLYLADYYEKELDNTTKNLATIIEPILLVIIGVVLGLLAVAIISPIYQFTGSLNR